MIRPLAVLALTLLGACSTTASPSATGSPGAEPTQTGTPLPTLAPSPTPVPTPNALGVELAARIAAFAAAVGPASAQVSRTVPEASVIHIEAAWATLDALQQLVDAEWTWVEGGTYPEATFRGCRELYRAWSNLMGIPGIPAQPPGSFREVVGAIRQAYGSSDEPALAAALLQLDDLNTAVGDLAATIDPTDACAE